MGEAGIIFRPGSLWVGLHYSRKNKRLCVNFFPCVTFWATHGDGSPPEYSIGVKLSKKEDDDPYDIQGVQW